MPDETGTETAVTSTTEGGPEQVMPSTWNFPHSRTI